MRPKASVTLAILLLPLFFSCERLGRLGATKIGDILNNPRKYEKKEVTVHGSVTGSVSLLVVKFFEIEDDTGSISVVTDRVLPEKGATIRVKGYVVPIEVGSERWIVLREKSDRRE